MENLFLKLLWTGNIKFDEGRLIILNAFQIILPVALLLKLQQLLLKIGKNKARAILKELGSYQVKQGLQRYKKLLQIEKLSPEKSMEFFVEHASLLGFGKFNLIKFEKNPIRIIVTSPNNPFAIEYKLVYGISKQPIDDYVVGIWEELYSYFLNKKLKCTETLCIACGDKVCQFEITECKD
jgi:predicted hydrocarbon binding protein